MHPSIKTIIYNNNNQFKDGNQNIQAVNTQTEQFNNWFTI